MEELAELVRTGKVRPAIDRTFDLDDTREALSYLEKGHARGKVVVEVG